MSTDQTPQAQERDGEILLSEAEFTAMAATIAHLVNPSPALVRLMRHYRERILYSNDDFIFIAGAEFSQ